VPGWHHGEVTDEQLTWLAELLSTPAEHGTILALHHPPIPSPMVSAAELIELHDTERLARVLQGTDVRAILGGHYHFSSHSTFAGIPVSVASATCYLADPAPLDRFISAVDGHQSVNAVHVYADRVVHTIVPVPEAPEVSGFGADVIPLFQALSPEERFDMVSRKDSDFNRGTTADAASSPPTS
jgi:3',5'-cyclic AMP phosphodiesterase CpdA